MFYFVLQYPLAHNLATNNKREISYYLEVSKSANSFSLILFCRLYPNFENKEHIFISTNFNLCPQINLYYIRKWIQVNLLSTYAPFCLWLLLWSVDPWKWELYRVKQEQQLPVVSTKDYFPEDLWTIPCLLKWAGKKNKTHKAMSSGIEGGQQKRRFYCHKCFP